MYLSTSYNNYTDGESDTDYPRNNINKKNSKKKGNGYGAGAGASASGGSSSKKVAARIRKRQRRNNNSQTSNNNSSKSLLSRKDVNLLSDDMDECKHSAGSCTSAVAHDAPMSKRDLYFCLRCGMVRVSAEHNLGQKEPETATSGTSVDDKYRMIVARVILINWDNDVVLDAFVQSPVPVLDFRTAETGVTARHIQADHALPLDQVRVQVKKLIKGKILIGHNLQLHLSALGLSHPWTDMRDTAKYRPYMVHAYTTSMHAPATKTGSNAAAQSTDALPPHKQPSHQASEVPFTKLLQRDLKSLLQDFLHWRERQLLQGSILAEAIGSLELYKLSRVDWEAELAVLTMQKEQQRAQRKQQQQQQRYWKQQKQQPQQSNNTATCGSDQKQQSHRYTRSSQQHLSKKISQQDQQYRDGEYNYYKSSHAPSSPNPYMITHESTMNNIMDPRLHRGCTQPRQQNQQQQYNHSYYNNANAHALTPPALIETSTVGSFSDTSSYHNATCALPTTAKSIPAVLTQTPNRQYQQRQRIEQQRRRYPGERKKPTETTAITGNPTAVISNDVTTDCWNSPVSLFLSADPTDDWNLKKKHTWAKPAAKQVVPIDVNQNLTAFHTTSTGSQDLWMSLTHESSQDGDAWNCSKNTSLTSSSSSLPAAQGITVPAVSAIKDSTRDNGEIEISQPQCCWTTATDSSLPLFVERTAATTTNIWGDRKASAPTSTSVESEEDLKLHLPANLLEDLDESQTMKASPPLSRQQQTHQDTRSLGYHLQDTNASARTLNLCQQQHHQETRSLEHHSEIYRSMDGYRQEQYHQDTNSVTVTATQPTRIGYRENAKQGYAPEEDALFLFGQLSLHGNEETVDGSASLFGRNPQENPWGA